MKSSHQNILVTKLTLPHTLWELRTPKVKSVKKIPLGKSTQALAAGGISVKIKTVFNPKMKVFKKDCAEVIIELYNPGEKPVSFNLKWTLPFQNQKQAPRWLIPSLFYKKNPQTFIAWLPSIDGPNDVPKLVNDYWTFRSDLMAVPMVMGWQSALGSVAMVMPERQLGAMTAIGFDNRAGQFALVGAWPRREEPRPRDLSCHTKVAEQVAKGEETSEIEYTTLDPKEKKVISFWLFDGDEDPHAYSPILQETFARWDSQYEITPWYPTADAMHHAAHGLYVWHYDDEYRSLWETGHYYPSAATNPQHVHRYEMHTGFVSGTPYAHALRQYGLRFGRKDEAEAGRKLLDHICENLTPWGSFWSCYYKEGNRWGSGWHSAEEWQTTPGKPSQELQARTLADATLYTARAALAEKANLKSKKLWTDAVIKNCDFVQRIQRKDGNPGQGYDKDDGHVIYWESHEGLLWIAALVEGYRLTGEKSYLETACKAGRYYETAVRDAYIVGAPEGTRYQPTSEDPMNGIISYVNLWMETGDKLWLELAGLCGEFLMTYRWQYNAVFPALSTCGIYKMKTKGWDISSPNNVCLHPYGLGCVPEMIELWKATGDAYLMKQNANYILALHQMMPPYDGCLDAKRGMMTERYYQTQDDGGKGQIMPVAHSWCTGLILLTGLTLQDKGHLYLEEATGALFVCEAVTVRKLRGGYEITNPWMTDLTLKLVVRKTKGSKKKYPAQIVLKAGEITTLKT